MGYQLIVGIFTGDTESAVRQLERYEKSQGQVSIAEAVAIVKTADGKDEVKMMGDPKKRGRRIGAVAGAILGVLGGPATMVILGAGGAAVGDLIASLLHSGVSKQTVDAVEEGIQPGSSAVIVIVEEEAGSLIARDLKEAGAEVLNEMVDSNAIKGKYLISPSGGMSQTQ